MYAPGKYRRESGEAEKPLRADEGISMASWLAFVVYNLSEVGGLCVRPGVDTVRVRAVYVAKLHFIVQIDPGGKNGVAK